MSARATNSRVAGGGGCACKGGIINQRGLWLVTYWDPRNEAGVCVEGSGGACSLPAPVVVMEVTGRVRLCGGRM